MKKLIVLCLLLLPMVVEATDVRGTVTQTWSAADTVADAAQYDTGYTPVIPLHEDCYFKFYWRTSAVPGVAIPNGSNDTLRVYFQGSANQSEWKTWLLDSGLVALDSGWVDVDLSCVDSNIGHWGRGMAIHKDTTTADVPDSVTLVRQLIYELWIMGRD